MAAITKSKLASIYRKIPIIRELVQIRESLSVVSSEVRALREMEYTRLVDFEFQDNPRYSDQKRLFRYSHQVNSQNGEDGMIAEIFKRIGETSRTFLEIGVGDGLENNTAWLLSKGWSGYWIDGEDRFSANILASPHRDRLRFEVAYVTKENIGAIIDRLGVSSELDLMSLDIDQNTYHLWTALPCLKPRVVVVEYNAAIPSDTEWIVPYGRNAVWDGTVKYGASLKAYERLGRELGYSLVGCDFTGINAFFVRSDLADTKFSAPFSSENHYEPPRYRLIGRRSYRGAVL